MANEVGIFFSFVLFIVGLSHVVCTKEWVDFFTDLAQKSYAGIIIAFYSLPPGLVILSFHNNWTPQFSLWITIAGWILTIKSIVYLMYPGLPRKKLLKTKWLGRTLGLMGAVMMLFSALSGLSFYW